MIELTDFDLSLFEDKKDTENAIPIITGKQGETWIKNLLDMFFIKEHWN